MVCYEGLRSLGGFYFYREVANGDGLMGVNHKKQQIIVICCFLLPFVAFFLKSAFAKSNRGAVV